MRPSVFLFLIVLACRVGAIHAAEQPVKELVGCQKRIGAVAFAPAMDGKGQVLATASDDGIIRLWDARSGEALRVLENEGRVWNELAFTADGQWLAAFANRGRAENAAAGPLQSIVRLWNAGTGTVLHDIVVTDGSISTLRLFPDGKHLLLAGAQNVKGRGQQFVWRCSIATGEVIERFEDKRPWSFSPDGRNAAGFFQVQNETGKPAFAPAVWNLQTGDILPLQAKIPHQAKVFAWSQDGTVFATAGQPDYGDSNSFYHTLAFWKVATGELIGTVPAGHPGSGQLVSGLNFSPDGRWLASTDGAIQLWDVANGDLLKQLQAPTPPQGRATGLTYPVFSTDGRWLAAATGDLRVLIWDLQATQKPAPIADAPVRILQEGRSSARAVAWSPRGDQIASAEGTILHFWNPQTGLPLHTRAAAGVIKKLAFSPDGQLLAACGEDQSVTLWDARNAQLIQVLGYHDWAPEALAWSPDGKLLASGSTRIGKTMGVVRLWDVVTRQPLKMLTETSQRVRAVAFSSDGKQILNGNFNGQVEIWDRAQVLAAPDIIEPSFTDATRMAPPRYGGQPASRLDTNAGAAVALVTSSDKKILLLGDNGEVCIWNEADPAKPVTINIHTPQTQGAYLPTEMAISTDGARLAVAMRSIRSPRGGMVRICDMQSNRLLRELSVEDGYIESLAWAPGNRQLATIGAHGGLRIWKIP